MGPQPANADAAAAFFLLASSSRIENKKKTVKLLRHYYLPGIDFSSSAGWSDLPKLGERVEKKNAGVFWHETKLELFSFGPWHVADCGHPEKAAWREKK